MTTSVTNSTATTSATQTSINSGISSLADNEQTFLALLTTQLKNQDPLSPMDSTQFTSQLTQMTGVEQQLTSNKLLQQLVNNQTSDVASAVGLIGKTATASGADAALKNGTASWVYNQGEDAKSASLQVTNSAGTVIWRGTPDSLAKGDHTFTWNGKDESGVTQPDGQYTLSVAATDSTGTAVTITNTQQGAVTAVQLVNGVTMVTINGVQTPESAITSVSASN